MSHNIKNTFNLGYVDTDSAKEYVKNGSLTLAENVDFINSGKDGNISNSIGNARINSIKLSSNDIYVGSAVWDEKVYLFYSSDSNNYVIEYIPQTGSIITVAIGDLSIPLSIDSDLDIFVLSTDIVNDKYLYWTGGLRQSNGELNGYKEYGRLHIADSKLDPTGYSDYSANFNRPNKLLLNYGYDDTISNNLLKHNSYIFYKRYINKYGENTVLSYPSRCVSVNLGDVFENNFIDIVGFPVPNDVETVEIFISNDSTATFFKIKTIDTTVEKNVTGFRFYNKNEYPVLDADASDILNYEIPYSNTELCIADNHLILGDLNNYREFTDTNGDVINKSKTFNYTSTIKNYENINLFSGSINEPATDIPVSMFFVDKSTYEIEVIFKSSNYSWDTYSKYVMTYTYYSGNDHIADMNAYFNGKNSQLTVVSDIAFKFVFATNGTTYPKTVTIKQSKENYGLNTNFAYNFGVVYFDDKSRNSGVSNVTQIKYTPQADGIIFGVQTQLTGILTPPYWATKYMIVRDKVNTNLTYFNTVKISTSGSRDDTNIIGLSNQNYANFLSDRYGEKISIFNLGLDIELEAEVLTLEEIEKEEALLTAPDNLPREYTYVYVVISDHASIELDNIFLYNDNKSIEAKNEVFYETSDVFDILNGTYLGDGIELEMYDTTVGEIDSTSVLDDKNTNYPIMKTDNVSLRDINHLGRGAYTVLDDVDFKQNATIIHSKKYSSSNNYNGLNVFSSALSNFIDLEQRYGSVEKLYYDNTNLIIGQKNKWHRIPIDKNLIVSADGQTSLSTSNDFMDERSLIPYNGDYGISDKRSFAVHGFQKYSIDQSKGIVLRLSIDGLSIINAMRDHEIRGYLRDYNKQEPIIGGYDPVKQEYLFTLKNAGIVMRFSEKKKQNVGHYKYSDIPKDYITINNDLLSVWNNSDLYLENSLNSSSFYGENSLWKLSYVINHEPFIVKDFQSISLQIDVDTNITFDTKSNNTSFIGQWLEREDVKYIDIPKDSNDLRVYGVGSVKGDQNPTFDEMRIYTSNKPTNIRVGDTLYSKNLYFPNTGEIGVITGYGDDYIDVTNVNYDILSDGFFLYTKRPTIEGDNIKGNYMEVTLEKESNFELFSSLTTMTLSSHT